MQMKDDTITFVRNRRIKAKVRFDEEYIVFTWKGDFEHF